MEVKAGYKQTEVGMIPDDWGTPTIETIIDEISMGPFGSDIKVSNFVSTGIPVLNGANVASERLKDAFENFVSIEKAKSLKKAVAHRGDIVVTHRGTLGQISYIPNNSAFDRYVVSQSQFRVRFTKEFAIPAWVVLYFRSEQGAKKLLEGKGHTGVPAIAAPTKTFRNLSIPLPPLAEQEVIVAALSDVDALLNSLDALITKKHLIKQGVMQELLTGKKRLPGFSGEWKWKTFGDVLSKCFSGATPSRIRSEYFKGNIRWITSTELNYNVITDTAEKITIDAVKSANLKMLPKNTFLMAITGLEAAGTRGRCGIVGEEATSNQSCMALFPTNELEVNYLFNYYVFAGDRLAFQYCQGTKQQSYTAQTVKLLPIYLPPIPEQTDIAEILSDMDIEIAALEQKREKTRLLKQGMMQELLTGRIRLM